MKIAVIGSGISGLSSAYYLSKKHKVDLFEKQDRFGGHSYTLDVVYGDKEKVAVDIGFMVFNKVTYPNLINFFEENAVKIEKSDMSFSVTVKDTNIEYSGSGLNGLFANKSNILNIKFLKMIKEIISFYKEAEKINENNYKSQTLGDFLKKKKLSNYFINFHIIPMVAAIWSMPPNLAEKMPMDLFLNYETYFNDILVKQIDPIETMAVAVFDKYNINDYQSELFRRKNEPNPVLFNELRKYLSHFIWNWDEFLGKCKITF